MRQRSAEAYSFCLLFQPTTAPFPHPTPQSADDFADDASDVEEALRQRMRATLEAATAVLQLVEAQAASGGGAAGGDNDPDAGLPSPTTGGARGRASNSKDAQVRVGAY